MPYQVRPKKIEVYTEGDNLIVLAPKSFDYFDSDNCLRKLCVVIYHSSFKKLLDIILIVSFAVMALALDFSTLDSRAKAYFHVPKMTFQIFMYINSAWFIAIAVIGKLLLNKDRFRMVSTGHRRPISSRP